MTNEFYITAGLPTIDYNDSPPTGDNIFLITAGLVANDYTPAGGLSIPVAKHVRSLSPNFHVY